MQIFPISTDSPNSINESKIPNNGVVSTQSENDALFEEQVRPKIVLKRNYMYLTADDLEQR